MRTLRIRKFWKKFCALLLCMTLMANSLIAFAEEAQPGAEPGVIDVVGETESQVDESDVVAEEETVTTTTVFSEDESVSEMEETTSTEVTSEEMATTEDNITEAEDEISLQDEDVDYEKPTPDRVAEAIEKFSESAIHFAEIAEGADKLSKVIAAGGGLAAIPGGTVAVLQLIGVVDDPTEKALSTIISKIDGVESTLNNMSSTLNQISNDLADMSADAKERDRQNKASESLRQYQDFRNTQVKELNTLIGEYHGKITAATRQWWENDGKKGILVLYAEDTSSKHTEGEIVSGYHYYESKEPLPVSINDLPKESDSGSKVILDKSYYVPSESVNLFFTPLSSNNMNVNTYSEDFVEAISPAITSAMNSRTGLICSEALYNEWDALNDDSKKATADLMATDILSSAIYQLSCETMSSAGNAEYVKDVIAAYKSYSENVMAKNRGLDALINMQFVTHGFEGEVKKDIKNICDSMIFSAGYYGTFALDIACQSSNISLKERQELQNIWTNTILFISDKEKSSLTGHDNYCYVRGAVINYDKYNLNSQIVSTYKTYPGEKKYIHYYADADVTGNWKISDINGKDATILPLESDYSRVLYNQYLRSRLDLDGKDSKESFAQYLRRNGVEIPYDFNGTFVTRYSGVQTFGLGENLSMKASNSYGNTFTNGTAYTINKTGKDNNCFILHDKVIADTFDTSGNFASNSIVAARAYYQEHKWFWYVDEGVVFATDGVNISHNVNKSKYNYFSDLNTDTVKLSKDINVLSIVQRDSAIVDEDSLLLGATIKYDEPTSSVLEYEEKEDWSDYPSKHIVTYADDVIQNDATYELEIDRAIEDAVNSNEFTASEVALSAVEKKELINRMRSILTLTQNKLKECDFLEYSDDELKEFSDGGYGYEDMIKDIATMTLPECYFNNYEECLLPLNCMKQAFKYEPSVKVKFVRNGNVIEKRVYQAYIVTPLFVIWDSINKEYYEYEIDYDEMDTSSALVSYYELKVRIPYIGDQTGSSLVMEQRNGEFACSTVSNEDKPYMKINVTDSNAFCYYKTSKADDILQDEELSVKEIGPQGYTGKAIKPSVDVTFNGDRLAEKQDYTLTYVNNTNVYTYAEGDPEFDSSKAPKIIIKGKGNYKDVREVYFVINKAKLDDSKISVTIADKLYTGKEIVNKPVVKYGTVTLKENVDYSLVYNYEDESKKEKTGRVNIDIRFTGNFEGTAHCSYLIYDKNMDVSKWYVAPVTNQTYTGTAICPELVVKVNKTDADILKLNDDYEIDWSNNINVGTATIIIKGKGSYEKYTKTKKVTFKIVQKDIKDATISVIGRTIYSGTALKPEVIIKDGDNGAIIPSDCYTVSYSNNTNVPAADAKKLPTVTITGKKNYKGKVTTDFAIQRAVITSLSPDLTVNIPDIVGTKGTITDKNLKPSVKLGKKTLTRNKDYTVAFTYDSSKELQSATITFIGNYEGSVTTDFKVINKKIDLKDEKIKISLGSLEYTYTGSKIIPEVNVSYKLDGADVSLAEGRDYKLVCANNLNAATASGKAAPSVKVVGMGAFSGNSELYKFTIKPTRLGAADYYVVVEDIKYNNDKEVTPKVKVVNYDTGKVLPASNYNVTFVNNREICTDISKLPSLDQAPRVEIRGKGNYITDDGWEPMEYFRIYKTDVNSLTYEKIPNQEYTARIIKPSGDAIKVYEDKNKKTLIPSDGNYSLSYASNIKVGVGTMYLTGKGEYGGTKKLTFLIVPKWLKLN